MRVVPNMLLASEDIKQKQNERCEVTSCNFNTFSVGEGAGLGGGGGGRGSRRIKRKLA